MRFSSVLLTVSAIAATAYGNCIDPEALAKLIDQAIETLGSTTIEPVTWHLVHKSNLFKIGDGEIFGLKNVSRSSLPTIQCKDGVAIVNAPIVLHNVRIVYPWETLREYKGHVYCELDTVRADIHFRRSENASVPIILDKFDIVHVKNTQVRVTGATYLTWITSRIISKVTQLLRQPLANRLEAEIGHSFVTILNRIDGMREICDNIPQSS